MAVLTASMLVHPDELTPKWIRRAQASGIPTLGLHPPGGKEAHNTLADLLRRLEEPAYRALLDEAAVAGLSIEYEMHAARYLLPAELFEAHPQWFRMNLSGERTTDFNCCVTNTEALDYMAERAAQTAKRLYRSSHRYFFWTDDAHDAFCHCPNCAQYSASDQQLLVVNHLLRRLQKDDPQAKMPYLAYFECLQPPAKVKPAPGVFLEYAPIERDMHKPIAGTGDAATLEALLDVFGREDAKVLEYWLDNSLFSGWKKPPKPFKADEPVVQADVPWYASLGFADISTFACFLGEDYEALHGEPDISPFAEAVCALLKKE